MQAMVNIAVRAARAAGDIIVRNMDRIDRLKIVTKQNNDFVSKVDLMAEQAIIDTLKQAFPEHGILAEESGQQDREAEFQWIIDPLDGTTNYLHGFPQFSVSIALQHRGRLEVGVIYDPISQELFTASRGNGATLNDRKIRVTGHKGLNNALLGTGFPYYDQSYLDTYLETMKALMQKTAGIRRPGSAALDLAWLAAGRIDGFWEFNLKAWDIAAGALIVREAGGIVSDFENKGNYLESGDIIAAAPKVFPEMLKIIQEKVNASDYLKK
ncbi:MAG TPA: inositol monophosphatase [Gammaproteobacteria bacterium]|nr:inositol monophosphatase [Gammaproteobacteria bacterium]